MPRIITLYIDQISEHQRDLTNSASMRFNSEIFAGLYATAVRIIKVCNRIHVDTEATQRNFNIHKDLLAAEPLYLLLAAHGHPDAHETIKNLAMKARAEKKPLQELAFKDKELLKYINQFKPEQRSIILQPEKYTGIASKKVEQVCQHWRREFGI